jgi:hypothetical protein
VSWPGHRWQLCTLHQVSVTLCTVTILPFGRIASFPPYFGVLAMPARPSQSAALTPGHPCAFHPNHFYCSLRHGSACLSPAHPLQPGAVSAHPGTAFQPSCSHAAAAEVRFVPQQQLMQPAPDPGIMPNTPPGVSCVLLSSSTASVQHRGQAQPHCCGQPYSVSTMVERQATTLGLQTRTWLSSEKKIMRESCCGCRRVGIRVRL